MDGKHFVPTKAVMPTFSQPPALVAIPSQATTIATGIFMQPPAAQTQHKLKQSKPVLNFSNFCHLCTPVGRKCPNNYISPDHSEWSDPEEEDWNGETENEEESRNKETEQNSVQKELNKNHITHLTLNIHPVMMVMHSSQSIQIHWCDHHHQRKKNA